MEQTLEEFFHDFRQETLADAESGESYQLEAFMDAVSKELLETGFIEGFEFCHFRTQRGVRVDGYHFHEGTLDLFVADFDSRRELETLTRTDAVAAFKRLSNFLESSLDGKLDPDVTTPEYGLIDKIVKRKSPFRQINLFLASERSLSERLQSIQDDEIRGVKASYHIWDISRLKRQRSSRGRKEPIEINFLELFGVGIPCLPANTSSASMESYLVVMPAKILASLYERYSARLLEQNVRTFLQARSKVNKGIRATIMGEPSMFFAYNNGITATAQDIKTISTGRGLEIVHLSDLQIVNGGQTTASLYHTNRKDKADLGDIFVQMKLSVIEPEESEAIVPRISEYANTQNRVNAADFFSNHPFHLRIEELSRRLWAPAVQGAQRETKWFYERSRGQYLDAQADKKPGERKRFKAEYPTSQKITKTDLAKFENVFDENPIWVNRGAQKNFAKFAERIGGEWNKSSTDINEYYFKRIVGRAIIFRTTEKLVSAQPWYEGGYRANIVSYTIASIAECCKLHKKELNWDRLWAEQAVGDVLEHSLVQAADFVNKILMKPPASSRNISEWAKKPDCWASIKSKINVLKQDLSTAFFADLLSREHLVASKEESAKVQVMDDGITAQIRVCNVPVAVWRKALQEGRRRKLLSEKEIGCLEVVVEMGNTRKPPTESQSKVILDAANKLREEGHIIKELF